MKKLFVLLISSIISFSSLAATEITKTEAQGYTLVGEDTITDRKINQSIERVSKLSDEKGADYFVITRILHQGNGDVVSVTAQFYKK